MSEQNDKVFLILAVRYEFQMGDARVQLEAGDVVWMSRGTMVEFRGRLGGFWGVGFEVDVKKHYVKNYCHVSLFSLQF